MDSQIRLKSVKYIYPDNHDFKDGTDGWDIVNYTWNPSYFGLGQGVLIPTPLSTSSISGTIISNISSGDILEIRLVAAIGTTATNSGITITINGNICTSYLATPLVKYFRLNCDSSFVGYNTYDISISVNNSTITGLILNTIIIEKINDPIEGILDLSEDIYNITYQVNDIRDISSRNSSFSKKLSIPITKNNQTIWNNVLDINSDTLLNDRYLYKSIDAELLYKTELIEKGFVRLVNINRDTNTFDIEFFGEIANLADACGDDLIFDNEDPSKDVDVSELQHTFNWETINSSWYTLKESGFTYPIIDYSIPDPNASNIFYLKDAKPAIRTKYLFDKILDSVNFKYDSTFLNSAPFTELINPWTGANIVSPLTYLRTSRSVYVNFLSNSTVAYQVSHGIEFKAIVFPHIVTDPSSQYSLTGCTIQNEGTYQVTTQLNVNLPHSLYLLTSKASVCIFLNGYIVSTSSPFIALGGQAMSGTCIAASTLNLVAGDVIKIGLIRSVTLSSTPPYPYIISTEILGSPTNSQSFFRLDPLVIQPNAHVGDTIDMSKIFGGEKIKKIDYIMSYVKMFNLIIDSDRNRDRYLKIETNDYYYSGGTLRDWTNYVDITTENVSRLSDIVNKSVSFEPTVDTDTYNKDYTYYFSKIYGENKVYDELKSKDNIVVKNIFAPTLLGYHSNTKVIVSKIYEKDQNDDTNSKVLERDFKPRTLYYKNIPIKTADRTMVLRPPEFPLIGDITLGFWFIPTTTTYCFQPYAGHLDDPYEDTLDINFGTMSNYFINMSGGTSDTINPFNLVNRYWINHLHNIMDHDSKLVTYMINIPVSEMKAFSMADTIRIKNTNYTINKIIDWSPNTFCKIELLKLADNYLKYKKKIYDPNQSRVSVNIIQDRPPQKVIDMSRPEMSAPIYLDGDGNPIYQGDTEVTPPVYYNNRTNIYDPKSNVIVIGSGNILNNSLNSYIVGDDNYININKEGVIIFGKNNNIS